MEGGYRNDSAQLMDCRPGGHIAASHHSTLAQAQAQAKRTRRPTTQNPSTTRVSRIATKREQHSLL